MPARPADAAGSDVRLVLRTLGGMALYVQRQDETPALALTAGKPLALLTYLALSPGRSASRERLIALLWANRKADQKSDGARNALRVTLANLRKLGANLVGPTTDPVVLTALVESDVHALVAAWERRDFPAVVDRFGGDFLPDFAAPGAEAFEEWAGAERTRLRAMFVRAADAVLHERLSVGHFREAESLARRVRDLDPLTDAGWRLLLECLVSTRDPLGLVTELATLDRLLTDDALALEPPTLALLRQARLSLGTMDTPAPEPTPALVSELVGREREFSAIMRAWEEATRGRTVQVLVVAPTGLGKTRLLDDVHARLRATKARVTHVAARYGARDIAYAFIGDLAAALGARRGARGVSRETARALVALAPTLSSAFDVGPDTSTGEEALRRRAVALRELVTALSEEQPFALLLDDLHWADPLSLRVLVGALDGVASCHLLILSASRGMPDELRGLAKRTLALEPLSEDAVQALLGSLAALPSVDWAARLPALLCTATGGSPLLVLETLQLLRERDVLTPAPDAWAAPDPEALFAALGEGSALHRRLEALSADERAALLLLAVAGVPLTTEQVSAAAAKALGAPLTTLERRGLATRRGDGWSSAHDEYAAALIERASDDEQRAAAAAVGRAIADEASDASRPLQWPSRLHLAASLLARGGDRDTLARLFALHARRRRVEGDHRSDRAIAEELLGTAANRSLASKLVHTLPWHLRARLVTTRRIAAAIALVVLLPPSVAIALNLLRGPAPSAEAVLLAERPSADHTTTDLFQVPLDAAQLASAAPVEIDLSHRPTWRLPDSVVRYAETRSARPDGQGWVFTRMVSDSGVLDLFDVGLDGHLRRLTYAKSDDLAQDWAPDGTQLVFATMRWAARGRLNLAVYDTLHRVVRRLTWSNDATDWSPIWSPDGSRIAYMHTPANTGGAALCLIDADGAHQRCQTPMSGRMLGVIAWTDARHVLIAADQRGTTRMVRLSLDTPGDSAEHALAPGSGRLSPDGRYVVCTCAHRGYPANTWLLFAIDSPEEVKPIQIAGGSASDVTLFWAPTSPRAPYVDTLHIGLGPGHVTVGTSYQLRATGVDVRGRPVEVGVVRWRSVDTTVATVDSTGLLWPHRTGSLTIEASAGGWRTARVTLEIRAPAASRVLIDEHWSRGFATTWRPFGVPTPVLVQSDVVGPAFLQTGDGSFSSGAYTTPTFNVRDGLWVEAALSVSLTDDGASQEQRLWLFVPLDPERWATWDHKTGFPPGERGCRLDYPNGPAGRPTRGDSVWLGAYPASRTARTLRRVRDGQPFRALVQIFPDGRCGFAFDGTPLWVSPPTYFDATARVLLEGNGQEAHVFVGPLRVASGIAPHVDWGRLNAVDVSHR